MSSVLSARTRVAIFVGVCLVVVVAAVITLTRGGDQPGVTESAGTAPVLDPAVAGLVGRPHAVFIDTKVGGRFGQVVVTDLARPDGAAFTTGLTCERVVASMNGGICLAADRGAVTKYRAVLFDKQFKPRFTKDLPGLPSRTRVSPGGTRGAMTSFVSGDSYASGTFSTRTEFLDLGTGESLGDLEQFAVAKDGAPFKAVDFNFWGVTFADESKFYATLGSGGQQYLVEGDLTRREATVRRDGIECPSLSPDGTRVAFKKRVTGDLGRVTWQLSVLDLATMVDKPVAETRSVDDQAFWLDNQTLLYSQPEADSGTPTQNTWAVPADGSGAPRLYAPGADSLIAIS